MAAKLTDIEEVTLMYVLTQCLNSMKKDSDGKYYDNGGILLMLTPDEMKALKKLVRFDEWLWK